MSLSFVHTARRYYRLNVLVRSSAWFSERLRSFGLYRKDAQTGSFRGSKSRNKVFVGEPAYGSLPLLLIFIIINYFNFAQFCLYRIVSHHYVKRQVVFTDLSINLSIQQIIVVCHWIWIECTYRNKIQFCTVDHSARYSMKSAAKCEKAMRIAGHIEHE